MDDLDEQLLTLIDGPPSSPPPGAASKKAKKRPAKKAAAAKRRRKQLDDSGDDDSLSSELSDADDSTSSLASLGDGDYSAGEMMAEFSPLADSELQGLTELEREHKLAEWAERKQQHLERMQIKQRLLAQQQGSKRQSAQSSSKTSRSDTRAKAKSKLDELKARRLKKQRRDVDNVAGEGEEVDMSDDGDEDYADRIRSTFAGGASADRSTSTRQLCLADICAAQIGRSDLERWMFASFFEDTVKGAFVRLGIGMGDDRQMTYRVCQVVGVSEYHRIYKINGAPTKKSLILRHGKNQKTFLMDIISNQPFTESEFNRWKRTMDVESQRLPSVFEVTRTHNNIDATRNHVFTNEEIEYMIKEKARNVPVGKNLAMEKLDLLGKREDAQQAGLVDEVERWQNDLDFVQTTLDGRSTDGTKTKIWDQLNARNRRRNLEDGRLAEAKLREERCLRLKDGKSHDPFARIKAMQEQTVQNDSTDQLSDKTASTPNTLSGHVSPAIIDSAPASRRASVPGASTFDQAFAEIDVEIEI